MVHYVHKDAVLNLTSSTVRSGPIARCVSLADIGLKIMILPLPRSCAVTRHPAHPLSCYQPQVSYDFILTPWAPPSYNQILYSRCQPLSASSLRPTWALRAQYLVLVPKSYIFDKRFHHTLEEKRSGRPQHLSHMSTTPVHQAPAGSFR